MLTALVEDVYFRRGQHLPVRGFSDRLARLRPSHFLHTALVACALVLIWPAALGGPFGIVSVAGRSMEPTLRLGDVVVTWKEPVEKGDVILYRVPENQPGAGNPVIHRVVDGGPDGWETQGDNMPEPDMWRPADGDVLGVAQFRIPLDGGFVAMFRSWWLVAASAGAAVALMLWPGGAQRQSSSRGGRHRAQLSSRVGR